MDFRVLVCGSRGWTDRDKMRQELDAASDIGGLGEMAHMVIDKVPPQEMVIIHGNARGADKMAGEIAEELGYQVEVYPADWAKYGKQAGFIRNQQMLREGKPDMCIAFWDGKSRGTLDMIERAKAAGHKVMVVKGD